MNQDVEDIVAPIVRQLEEAWNAGDGRVFAVPFAPDADFVDIRGQYHSGRESIAFGHQAIFDTIYKGSHNRYEVLQARRLTPDVVLAQVSGRLSVPAGPLAGENRATFTLVITASAGGWQIAALHNTLIPPQIHPEERKVRDSI